MCVGMHNIMRTRMFMHDYERMGAMCTEVINVPLYGSLSTNIHCIFIIMFSVEIVIAILFSIVQLSLSGSMTQSTHSLRKENQQ